MKRENSTTSNKQIQQEPDILPYLNNTESPIDIQPSTDIHQSNVSPTRHDVIQNDTTECWDINNELNGFAPVNAFDKFDADGAEAQRLFARDMDICELTMSIHKYNQWKSLFKYGVIWNFDIQHKTKMAVLLIYITKKSAKFQYANDPLSDARYQYFKLLNALNYGYAHLYDVVLLTKPLYENNSTDNKYRSFMNAPTWQKAFIIKHLFTDTSYQYEWILYNDFDALFINCSSAMSIPHFVNLAYSNPNVINKEDVSFIFTGDNMIYANAGVFIIKNNEWSLKLLNDIIYAVMNADIFKWNTLHHLKLKDQKVLCALMGGWNVNDDNYRNIQRNISKMWVRNKTDDDYLNCVKNENMKQYAIPIERYYFSVIPGDWFHSIRSDRQYILMIHFMGEKARTDMVKTFWIFHEATEHCPITI